MLASGLHVEAEEQLGYTPKASPLNASLKASPLNALNLIVCAYACAYECSHTPFTHTSNRASRVKSRTARRDGLGSAHERPRASTHVCGPIRLSASRAARAPAQPISCPRLQAKPPLSISHCTLRPRAQCTHGRHAHHLVCRRGLQRTPRQASPRRTTSSSSTTPPKTTPTLRLSQDNQHQLFSLPPKLLPATW